MKITNAFIIRLVKMPEQERTQFLHENRDEIDFTALGTRVKEMASEALMKDEYGLADKFIAIKEDIVLYESRQRHPGAVDDVLIVTNPTPMMAVM
ncbi:MAG: hypothetical protein ABI675_19550 [Chitinophagaceae bacterium]